MHVAYMCDDLYAETCEDSFTEARDLNAINKKEF